MGRISSLEPALQSAIFSIADYAAECEMSAEDISSVWHLGIAGAMREKHEAPARHPWLSLGDGIEFDLSALRADVEQLLPELLGGLVNHLLDDPERLFARLGLDFCITSSGTALLTGDHVIRLGLLRVVEGNAAALGALESDFVGHG
jgi:hypothetical protein